MEPDLEFLYQGKSDDELLKIVHSPLYYRADAQELAKELLLERGLTEDLINQWRDPDARFAIPIWYRIPAGSDLRGKFNFHRRLHLLFYLSLGLGIIYSLIQPDFSTFLVLFSIYSNGLIYFCFLYGVFWQTPLRILLLRPFMFSKNRKHLRYFAKNYLRFLGHTYTISDTEIKPRVVFFESRIFIVSFFWFFFRTSYKIRRFEDMPKLKAFVGRRIVRNIAWFLSWDKLFKISCTPETWKYAVQHLINSVQVIIVDLSNVGEGLKWEMEELAFYNSLGKVVIITHKDCVDSTKSFLSSSVLSEYDKEIFVYGDNGWVTKHKEFIATLTAAANWSVTSDTPFWTTAPH